MSRYLLSQTAINAAFGVLATLGLFLLGVPYALLFGLLGGASLHSLRGPWIGALLPVGVSLAIFPGWTRPLLLLAFWLVLELFTNLVLETVFWARSAGVSHVGLLLAVGLLALAGGDHARGRIDPDEYRYVIQALRAIVEELTAAAADGEAPPDSRVFGAAVRGEADAVGLLMLRDGLAPARVALDAASSDLLSAEVVRDVREHGADIVVVGAVPPGGVAQARYLCCCRRGPMRSPRAWSRRAI